MVTPELIGYIKGELVKGRTREDIHSTLVSDGGWSEDDLNEAFGSVLSTHDLSALDTAVQDSEISSVAKNKTISRSFLENLIFIVVGLTLVFSWYFFRPQIISFWDSGVDGWGSGIDKLSELFVPLFNHKTNIVKEKIDVMMPLENQANVFVTNTIKDCGTSVVPNLKNPTAYQDDPVLACLGASVAVCKPARAVLSDTLFPNIFEILKNQDTCNFRLSYSADSTLVDITGKKLALQYISCPISIVKEIDETKHPTLFKNPDINNSSKYGSQIYFYGTLGLFLENNIDQNKIDAVGCSGDYIKTVLAGYNKMQSKK